MAASCGNSTFTNLRNPIMTAPLTLCIQFPFPWSSSVFVVDGFLNDNCSGKSELETSNIRTSLGRGKLPITVEREIMESNG